MRSALPPLEDRIRPIPYVELQRAGDATFPRGDRFFWKAQFLRNIPDAAIDSLLDMYLAAPSPRSLFVFQQVGGAIARAPTEKSAYANRDAAFDAFPVSIWSDPAGDEANVGWAIATYEAMRPFGTNGVYVNNLGDEGEDRVRAAYGGNYRRLAALKRKFDPSKSFSAQIKTSALRTDPVPLFIVLLRAVNVGGRGKLPMGDLKRLCEKAGFRNVRTYIASGNVVTERDGSEAEAKAALEAELEAYAGKPVGMIVRTAAEMAKVVALNPFPDGLPTERSRSSSTTRPLPKRWKISKAKQTRRSA